MVEGRPTTDTMLEVIVAKQRNGPTGTVHLHCEVDCAAIRDKTGAR